MYQSGRSVRPICGAAASMARMSGASSSRRRWFAPTPLPGTSRGSQARLRGRGGSVTSGAAGTAAARRRAVSLRRRGGASVPA